MRKQITSLTALSAMFVGGTTATSVFAADIPEQTEIVVTAEKRESKLLDIAAPISVISGERITERNISSFDELVEQIPGVSVTAD